MYVFGVMNFLATILCFFALPNQLNRTVSEETLAVLNGEEDDAKEEDEE